MRKERKRERKKDSQTQQNDKEREKEERVGRVSSNPTPDAVARSRPNPRRSGEIAPLSSQFALPISLFLDLPLPFEPSLIIADLLDRQSLSRQSALSPICLISDFFVVVVVVWVVAFWWFLCCVVVGFVWIVVDFLGVVVCGWWWIF